MASATTGLRLGKYIVCHTNVSFNGKQSDVFQSDKARPRNINDAFGEKGQSAIDILSASGSVGRQAETCAPEKRDRRKGSSPPARGLVGQCVCGITILNAPQTPV